MEMCAFLKESVTLEVCGEEFSSELNLTLEPSL